MKKHRIIRVVLFTVFSALVILTLQACGGGGGDSGGGGSQPPPNSVFNGTFSGEIITTQREERIINTMDISLTTNSPLSGKFFIEGGGVGTLSGDAEGDTATFSGTIDDICAGLFNGSITLLDDQTYSIDMTGSDCNGPFISGGDLSREECVNIDGKWRASESVTVTCEGDTETISGSETVFIMQNGCDVSYPPPSIDAPRSGKIDGNNISLSGSFVVPLVGGVNFSKNIVTLEALLLTKKILH